MIKRQRQAYLSGYRQALVRCRCDLNAMAERHDGEVAGLRELATKYDRALTELTDRFRMLEVALVAEGVELTSRPDSRQLLN